MSTKTKKRDKETAASINKRINEMVDGKKKAAKKKPAIKSVGKPTTAEKIVSGDGALNALDAAARVLKSHKGTAMSIPQIAKEAMEKGLWLPTGKTPMQSLSCALQREIAGKGKESRFARDKQHHSHFRLTGV